MSRYFFHIKKGAEITVDEEGEEFGTLEAARGVAVESARQIMSDNVLKGEAPDGCTFVIADEAGKTIFEFPFKDAFNRR